MYTGVVIMMDGLKIKVKCNLIKVYANLSYQNVECTYKVHKDVKKIINGTKYKF